jgi:hypothetical protein
LTEAIANQFASVPQGATPSFGVNLNAGDPYWEKVVFYANFNGVHAATTATDSSNQSLDLTFYGGGSANGAPYITSADARFGTTSLLCPGVTGSVYVGGLTNVLSGTSTDPTNSWTIEFWCKAITRPPNAETLVPFTFATNVQSALSAVDSYTQIFGFETIIGPNLQQPFAGYVQQPNYYNCDPCSEYACCRPGGYAGDAGTGITLAQSNTFLHTQSAVLAYPNYCTFYYNSELASSSALSAIAISSLSGTGLVVNKWHHVALCDNGDKGRITVDGKLASYFKTTICGGKFAGLSEGPLFIIGAQNPHSVPGVSALPGGHHASSNFWSGYIDEFRVTRNVARYTTNFMPAIGFAPTSPYLAPDDTEYSCPVTTIVAETYGTELQFKALVAGDNVTFACTQSSIKIGADIPGLKGTLFSATCAMPTSGSPVTISHNLAGTPEIIKVTAQVIPQIYPVTDPTPYEVDDELDIESFERTKVLGSTALSALTGLHWDELYNYTIGPSAITIARNIGTGDERLSFVTKSGNRYYAVDDAELSASFKLKVSLIQGGLNYPGALNQSDEIYVDGNDNSLFEWSSFNQGVRKRYLRVRTSGIQEHHIDNDQIKTRHIDDDQVTARTLDNVLIMPAGQYSYPLLTVDAQGRITSIQNQNAISSLEGLGIGSDDVEDISFRPVDVHFNDPSNYEPPMDVDTSRIGPSGTFDNWSGSSYDNIPHHSLSAEIGLYDPYIVKLPAGTKRVKIKCWGAGGGGNVHAAPSHYVYNGGSGGYAENTFTIDDRLTELTVWIGKGGRTADYGLSGAPGKELALSRPEALSAIIMDRDPIGGLHYDQMHPPGCGGDTFVTTIGVSGNPITIIKAYGGGVNYRLNAEYITLTASSDWTELRGVTCASRADRSSTRISYPDRIVQNLEGVDVSDSVTFFTDPFDTGFGTAWTAGASALSSLQLEPVIGFKLPEVANVLNDQPVFPLTASEGESYHMLTPNAPPISGASLTVVHNKFKPHWTFSTAGEPGMSIYQDVNVCLPEYAPQGVPCWVAMPERAATSFGSSKGSYGTGGVYNSRVLPVSTSPDIGILEHGHDGGCVVEVL